MRKSRGIFRGGMVHIMSRRCDTCIFRPGNLMQLERGRVAAMVAEAKRKDSCIPCHETTHGQAKGKAVCRGFFELYATMPLRLALVMGKIVFDELPKKENKKALHGKNISGTEHLRRQSSRRTSTRQPGSTPGGLERNRSKAASDRSTKR